MSEVLTDKKAGSINQAKNFFNPFPGLRPFNINESHLFFGREGQSEDVLKNLSEKRFVAVIGASGSGKSSLMYCGLTPILHGGFITDAGSKWRIIPTRPGAAPIENLAASLVKSDADKISEEDLQIRKAISTSVLKTSSLGLVEAVKHLKRPDNENILLLVDQFEELFRFKRSNNDISSFNESVAYVKLLLEAVEQTDLPIYIVLTMRSDFIGECAQFQELTNLINESHYLIPQMTRDDLKNAITGPVAVGGGKIAPRLVQQLLNEIGDNQDQLPILQHALMRTWDYWSKYRTGDEVMDIVHYEAIGKMEKALSDHANEAYDELSSKGKEICESLFKSLTERGSDNRGIRRPSSVKEVANIATASEKELIDVVEIFRSVGRSFLTSAHEKLSGESIVDISHESLMRIWDRLTVWVDEEANAVQMYIRLSEAAGLYQEGKTGLWRPPDLQLAINWERKQKPTLTWAQRHNPAFERTMLYLETSEKAYEAEEQNKIKLQKKALKRTRVFAVVLGVAAVAAIGVMLYAFTQQVEADKQRKLAEEKTKEAEQQTKEAEKQTKEANKQKDLAETERLNAKQSAEEAVSAQKDAESNLEEANRQKSIANQQTNVANQKSEEAKQQAIIADSEKKKAEASAEEAKKATAQAQNLRMQSIGKSMSIKSLQIKRDLDKKALVSYQAFLFNKKHGGVEHDADIYAGLYDAIKSKNKSGHNVLKGHKSSVIAMQYTNDGKSMISAEAKGSILKWDVSTEKPNYTTIVEDNAKFRSMVVSNDNKHIAVGTESSAIKLIDLTTNTSKELKGHKGIVWSLAFTPDNKKIISASADSTILLWNVADESNIIIAKSKSTIKSIAISPDGNHIAGGTEHGELIIWDRTKANTSTIIAKDESRDIQIVRFSHDGKYLVTGDKFGLINVYNFSTRTLETTLVGHGARVNDLKFSPDDRFLASASFDGTVQLFLTSDFDLSPIVLGDHETWVWSVAFNADGETLMTGTMGADITKYPTNASAMAETICYKLSRNMTQKEWNRYVAKDIPLEKTCENLPLNTN